MKGLISKVTSKKLSELLELSMPTDALYQGDRSWMDFFWSVYCKHAFINMFAEPSLAERRYFRWVVLCRTIMVMLFIDTLFFGLFFADDGTCEGHDTRAKCEQEQNQLINANQCSFDESSGECSLNEPPDSVEFTILLSVITVILVLPVDLAMRHLH